GRRRRRRDLVLDPRRRRRHGHRRRPRARPARGLQRRRRRPGVRRRVAAVPCRGGRREEADGGAGLARSARRRRGPRLDDDPDPRFVEREGEARARLAAALGELAGRLPGWPRGMNASELAGLRPLLFSIAYRMLASVGDAEDVVQEAFLRYQSAVRDGVEVEAPKASLSAVAMRLAIDQLRSARRRRESYVGEWLPEPLLTDEGDPARATEEADSLSMAFLLVLERLGPVERAVFLLHD